MPSLTSDIEGRVKRLPLRPSATTALLPLFEAVANSLHAIQERFGEESTDKGLVNIEIVRAGSGDEQRIVSGFSVSDNGVGFTDENFNSFLKPDSVYKIARGGKGIGRLGWLKVFKEVSLDSAYVDRNGKLLTRSFDFVLAPEEQVVLRSPRVHFSQTGTSVTLSNFDGLYGPKCPTRAKTILDKLIAHFIAIFATRSGPRIRYIDDDFLVEDLRAYFDSKVVEIFAEDAEIELSDGQVVKLHLRHMKADKDIRAEPAKYNWLYFAGDDRVVEDVCVDQQLGLKILDDEKVYIGTVSGDFLDEHVNQERTAFTIDAADSLLIRRACAGKVRTYLESYVVRILEEKRKITNGLISDNPQFLYLKGEVQSFVQGLPPNANDREQILVEMCRHRFRRQREFRTVERELRQSGALSKAVSDKIEQYQKFIQNEQKGALAEYVLKRKSILDILDKYTEFADADLRRQHLEEAVHDLICPMRVDSSMLDVEDHNLWILDDRLAFFDFFSSDREFRKFSEIDSAERPDLAFFYDACLAWREGNRGTNSVVIVEFKRPGRENYNSNENPLSQVLGYVDKFKTGTTLRDSKGRVLGPAIGKAAFQCYIVADLTEKLHEQLRGFGDPTPDGQGLFGYTKRPEAYVEIVPYEKLLRDARARNAIFFEKLGLNDFGKA